MIRLRTLAGGLLALALSGGLHAAGLLIAVPAPQRLEIAGGGAPDHAALGAAFADFVAGSTPVTPPAQPPVAQPVTARSLALPASAVADLAVPVAPAAATSAPVASTVAPPVSPRETAAQAAPDPAHALPDSAPATSLRPVARPARQAAPSPQANPQASPQRQAGNAPTDATRGSTQASPQGQAAASGAAPAPDSTGGQAAAASYPGQVLRQITRVRRQNAPARGSVVVRFAIAASGALADVSVAQSSGSAALDRLALDHIRRAAPFPAPPAGAQTAFSFEFVGRP